VPGPTDELRAAAAAWAEQSALAQGLPAKVEQAEVLRAVAVLLGMKAKHSGSGAPDGSEPGRVEAVIAAPAWSDDDVVEHGGNDLLLPGQAQAGPSLA
jgi:hypothetical protein